MFRWRFLTAMLLTLLLLSSFPVAAQGGDVYVDPDGQFSVPIPEGWTAQTQDDYVMLTDPDGLLVVYIMTERTTFVEGAIADAWAMIAPEFDLEPISEYYTSDTFDLIVLNSYRGAPSGVFFQGTGLRYGDATYVLLAAGDYEASVRRMAQLNIIYSGFSIDPHATPAVASVTALPFDAAMGAEFDEFMAWALTGYDIPGVAVAIVQDGDLVFSGGYGVRNPAGDPMTPDTQMMIGSVTKTFTTLLMAQLVDEGLVTWDTPIQTIYPEFAVADPALSSVITLQNTVCACTGVPREDLDWFFDPLAPYQIIERLADFEFFTDIGEAFQYSNQMVSVGGYMAALVDGGRVQSLTTDYADSVQHRILDPLEMTATTFSFHDIERSDNFAVPYAQDILKGLVAIDPELGALFVNIEPAAGLWSTAHDMARYLGMEENSGVSREGVRVVSAENLQRTWEPQVPIDADTSYGLGWIVGEYAGVPMLSHGGNTFGFTTEFAFLPEQHIGVVVLANAAQVNDFNEIIRDHVFEMLLNTARDSIERLSSYLDTAMRNANEFGPLYYPPAEGDVLRYVGVYLHPVLGVVTIDYQNGEFIMDAGEWQTILRIMPPSDETDLGHAADIPHFIAMNPPVAGLYIWFPDNLVDGAPILGIGALGVDDYLFTKVK